MGYRFEDFDRSFMYIEKKKILKEKEKKILCVKKGFFYVQKGGTIRLSMIVTLFIYTVVPTPKGSFFLKKSAANRISQRAVLIYSKGQSKFLVLKQDFSVII